MNYHKLLFLLHLQWKQVLGQIQSYNINQLITITEIFVTLLNFTLVLSIVSFGHTNLQTVNTKIINNKCYIYFYFWIIHIHVIAQNIVKYIILPRSINASELKEIPQCCIMDEDIPVQGRQYHVQNQKGK